MLLSVYTSLVDNSKLPGKITYNSAARFTSIKFDNNDILKIIRSLNINKAHGHDDISVRMIKMCDESLVQPLSLILRGCIDTGIYPDTWKKSNIVPVHKKGDKQIENNYRPVSLLPICSKILEKIIFDSIMRFLNKNKLLSDAQSGFRPSDSCEYQLLSIVYNIYKSFDCSPPLEVRGFFQTFLKPLTEFGMMVDIIMSFGISETPLKLIENFMSNRSQIVVLNDLHLGQRFQLGFLRDLFWGLCFS